MGQTRIFHRRESSDDEDSQLLTKNGTKNQDGAFLPNETVCPSDQQVTSTEPKSREGSWELSAHKRCPVCEPHDKRAADNGRSRGGPCRQPPGHSQCLLPDWELRSLSSSQANRGWVCCLFSASAMRVLRSQVYK